VVLSRPATTRTCAPSAAQDSTHPVAGRLRQPLATRVTLGQHGDEILRELGGGGSRRCAPRA
jgi:hypothetical protein